MNVSRTVSMMWCFQYAGGSAQFSPVEDGRIYSVEITEDTIQAVDQALEGEDYSQGAPLFHGPPEFRQQQRRMVRQRAETSVFLRRS
ncbi:MAG: cell wall hydrolase [Lachnospiraceae bacterium]